MITIFCHLYHQCMWNEMHIYLQKITCPKKVYVNLVNDQSDLTHIKKIIRDCYPDATILVSPNQGRDCGGNLRLINRWLNDGAPGELIIQCHTKSNHEWRSALFHPIFDNLDYIDYLFSNLRVGMVGSNDWLISRYSDVNMNIYNIYRNRFGMSLDAPMTFIGGTVFCVRSSIYKDFFSKFNPNDLANELEHGPMNEPSFTHSMERIFGGIVTHMGYLIYPANYAKSLLDLFDEQYYLSQNSDVLNMIGHKTYSAFSHFLRWGRFEGRQMNSMSFDEEYYKKNNPEINENGYLHFVKSGFAENRLARFKPNFNLREIVFDEEFYLNKYPDVHKSMKERGWPRTGYQHYLLNGRVEGREAVWNPLVKKIPK